jgi:hypothetical protein
MSVTALSFEAGLSEQRIRSLETGRTAVALAVLVALADVFEVGLADLFGDGTAPAPESDAIDAPTSSPHVVPSPVIWGGELPPAPWMTSGSGVDAAPAPVSAPAPASVPAPTPAGAPEVAPAPVTSTPMPVSSAQRPPTSGFAPHIAPGAGALPPAPWQTSTGRAAIHSSSPDPRAVFSNDGPAVPPAPDHAPSVAPRVHQRAAERGMREASAYVFVAPGASAVTAPRTFADLRVGPLAGRNFRSLQEFAVASVVEGDHAVADVARVFRVPVWRLEQWVRESGHAV